MELKSSWLLYWINQDTHPKYIHIFSNSMLRHFQHIHARILIHSHTYKVEKDGLKTKKSRDNLQKITE